MLDPVAITAVILGLLSIGDINWWVATPILNMVTLVVGLLIVRKLRRFPMFFAFLIASIGLAIFTYVLPSNISAVEFARQVFFCVATHFLRHNNVHRTDDDAADQAQIVYGVIVGLLFSSQLHIGNFYMSPELALVIGNIFSYLASSNKSYFTFEI